MNLLEKIVSAQLKTSELFVPQWDVTVIVRELDAGQRADLATDLQKNNRKATVRAVIACVLDPETSKPLFESAHQDLLMTKSAAAVELISTEILRLSGMLKEDAEELEKN
jgi:hypothetical protein